MRFEVIRTLTEFEKLADEWRDVFSKSDQRHNIFASFDWHRAVLHTFWPKFNDGYLELAIVVGRRRGKAELICPTAVKKRFGITTVNWIGAPVSQYGDVIIMPSGGRDHLIDAALKFLAHETNADAMILERVREDSAVADTLKKKRHRELRRQQAPFIDLDGFASSEKFIASLSSSRRKKLRRFWRRLCELGPAKFEINSAGPDALLKTQEVLKLKTTMLADQGTFSRAFADPYFIPFFEHVASTPDANVGFQVSALTQGENIVAAEIGFRSGDAYIAHVGVYDGDLKRLAPGHLLMERTLQEGMENGIRLFDFLAPEDDYKLSWSNSSKEVVDYALPLTLAGSVYCGCAKISGPATKILKAALPASLMRRAAHK